jgi:hypothetical protein
MSIHLHIDRLIVDGLPLTRRGRASPCARTWKCGSGNCSRVRHLRHRVPAMHWMSCRPRRLPGVRRRQIRDIALPTHCTRRSRRISRRQLGRASRMSERSASALVKPAAGAPPRSGFLQRKCACGAQSYGHSECTECAKKRSTVQRQLTIGTSNDPLEQEAEASRRTRSCRRRRRVRRCACSVRNRHPEVIRRRQCQRASIACWKLRKAAR